jgi:hypothetical protein
MCWNQPTRVDHLRKKWRAGGKKIKNKRSSLALFKASSVDQQSVGDHWSPTARRRLDKAKLPLVLKK